MMIFDWVTVNMLQVEAKVTINVILLLTIVCTLHVNLSKWI